MGLEFELAYYGLVVQHINHYATETLSLLPTKKFIQTVIRYHALLSIKNNLHTITWFQVFLSNPNNFHTFMISNIADDNNDNLGFRDTNESPNLGQTTRP